MGKKKKKKKTSIFSYLSYTHLSFECALKDNTSQSFLKKKLLATFNHGYQSITSLTRLSHLKTFLHFFKFSRFIKIFQDCQNRHTG